MSAPPTSPRQVRQIQQEASGGRADIGGAEQSVRTIGTVQSVAELADMDIVLTDGRRIRLDQVATVTDTVAERRSAALLNGQPVVGFEITRSRGAGETEVAEGVRAQLERLRAEHPDVQITEAFNFVDSVRDNFEGSMALSDGGGHPGGAGGLALPARLARDLHRRHGPAAVHPARLRRHVFHGLHPQYRDPARLSLVVGILVDDAIVEIENIVRHLRWASRPTRPPWRPPTRSGWR